jgi:hypothetical protein
MEGSVVELFVSVASAERRNGGVESGGVAEAGVKVAGGEGTRHAAGGAGARQRRATDDRGLALVFRPHLARDVDLGPGDVGVHVHATVHDDEAGGVEDFVGTDVGVARRRDDLALPNPDVSGDAVDAVLRVVDSAVSYF